MEITLHEHRCVGAGQCVLAAAEVFDQRADDGIAVLIEEDPGEEFRPQVLAAAARCPAQAIDVS
ncbi:ferredoxin [Spirillospora sp. CA-255316]